MDTFTWEHNSGSMGAIVIQLEFIHMKPEVKYRLIEKLIHTEDEDLLNQVQEILESTELTEKQKQELDRRMEKYEKGETKLYTWDEVKERIRKGL
jgi:putative addiction module component (TIGR02574 family)